MVKGHVPNPSRGNAFSLYMANALKKALQRGENVKTEGDATEYFL